MLKVKAGVPLSKARGTARHLTCCVFVYEAAPKCEREVMEKKKERVFSKIFDWINKG